MGANTKKTFINKWLLSNILSFTDFRLVSTPVDY